MRLRRYVERLAKRMAAAEIHCGHGAGNVFDEAVFLVFGALELDFGLSIADQDRELAPEQIDRLEKLADARIRQRLPTAYLLGKAWFAGHEFVCDQRALIPRSPFAELIENGFQPLLKHAPAAVLDLCCGGGCIGIACALRFPGCRATLADISGQALALARENIALHGLAGRVATAQSDLFDALDGRFDLILSNPPYVCAREMAQLPAEYRHEPALGLAGGADGMDLVERLLAGAANRLKADGWLILETGNSADALARRYPDVEFLWLEFERGGDGVCALKRQQLQRFAGF